MAAHQAPPSLGFSRQEHWSGLPFPSPMHESEKWKWSCSVGPTLHDPMDCSLPGSSIHGIFQARVLEWGAIAFSDCHCLDNVKATRLKASLPIIELIQTTLPSGDAGWVWNSVAQQDCWHWWWNLVWYLPIHLLHNHELPCYRQLKRVSLFDGVII